MSLNPRSSNHLSRRLRYLPLCAPFLALACSGAPNPAAPTGASPPASSPASHGDSADASTNHFTLPVAFSFPAGACGLAANVTAIGSIDFKMHWVALPDGQVRLTIHSEAKGTASGDDGSSYVFSYEQSVVQENTAVDPIPVRVTDVFELLGQGSTPNVKTGFIATFQLSGGNIIDPQFKAVRGNPFGCDPL